MEARYLKRSEEYIWRDIGGEVVILNDEGTQVCLLNKTAAQIWTLLDGTKTLEEIAAQICERFEVSPDEAREDVQDFVQQLTQAHLAG
jgi:hypothetical protein